MTTESEATEKKGGMSTLTISNGYSVPLLGLGRNRAIHDLSQKRITKAEREELRRHYGLSNVEVCCAAKLTSDGWSGFCKIHHEEFLYKICGMTTPNGEWHAR